jgi:prolyl 4-hydroxylase
LGLGVSQDWPAAVGYLAGAAQLGHPAAMRELAMAAEFASGKMCVGDGLLAEAARKGDWIAQSYAVRRKGILGPDEALALRGRLRGAGVSFVQLESPEDSGPEPAAPASVVLDIKGLEALAAPTFPESHFIPTVLNDKPDIYRIDELLSGDECDYLICASAPLLTPSLVVDPVKGRADHAQYRSSDGAMFGLLDLDLALIALYARLARAANVAWENCELIGVLRYRPGQEYRPHHDYLPADENDYSEVRRSGQRARTLLVSLNDDYEGGATSFPRLDIDYCGAKGDALVFSNTNEAGTPYPETLHAGMPVVSGEKWLLSLWCRERRFWFWD